MRIAPQFRLRTLLVALLVFALGFSAVRQLSLRVLYCRQCAQYHALRAASHQAAAESRRLEFAVATIAVREYREARLDMIEDSNSVVASAKRRLKIGEKRSSLSAAQQSELRLRTESELISEVEASLQALSREQAAAKNHTQVRQAFETAAWRFWRALPQADTDTE